MAKSYYFSRIIILMISNKYLNIYKEFFGNNDSTVCWANISNLPKNLHTGLKSTLTNKITQTKIETVLIMETSK